MRWLVTGAGGMLGIDFVELLRARGHAVRAADRTRLDITDEAAVAAALAGQDAVVNCAAWTAVDDAETAEAGAFQVNAVGPAVLARAAKDADVRLVQVSTDYVFDGSAEEPYPEDAPVRPTSAYGRTKAAGEWAVRAEHPDGSLVVRTAWLYGARGGCFPRTIARVARERGAVSVVDDQVGQPTWTVDVADLVERLVVADAPAGLGAEVVSPTTSEHFVRPAPRPAYSVLGHDALRTVGVEPIGDWQARWKVAAPLVLR